MIILRVVEETGFSRISSDWLVDTQKRGYSQK